MADRIVAGRCLRFSGATGVLVVGVVQEEYVADGEKGGCPSAYEPANEPATAECSAILGDIIDVPSEAFGLFSRRLG